MTSIKVKFRPAASSGREGSLYFQIIHNRIVRQWSPGYRLYPSEWDARKSSVIVSGPSDRRGYLADIREKVTSDLDSFRRVVAYFTANRDSFSADEILGEFLTRLREQPFLKFMESVIARLKELGRRRTSETYSSALNSFRRFLKKKDIPFDNIDSSLMESYQAFLRGKGLIPNSISFYMRILRAVYNRGLERGITEDRKPFRHVYTGIDKTIKRAIDIKTLRRIKDADLNAYPKAAFARDIFILSFYLRGMSFVDMAFLKKSDLKYGILTYRRRKTGQRLSIRWTPEMQDLLDRYPKNKTEYLLPIITNSAASPYNQYRSKQYKINTALKTVARKVGLKMSLTLYCSRHSWASIAKSKGIPVGVISDGLGHDSELTTQIYLSTLDTSAVDRANDLIIKSL